MTVSETKLLPCPFCGGQARFERAGNARQSCIIGCEDCSCRLETGEVFHQGTLWNTRALTAALSDQAGGEPYLVWSNQHRAWWRANSHGYTNDVRSAGLYDREEAISISGQGRDGWLEPKKARQTNWRSRSAHYQKTSAP